MSSRGGARRFVSAAAPLNGPKSGTFFRAPPLLLSASCLLSVVIIGLYFALGGPALPRAAASAGGERDTLILRVRRVFAPGASGSRSLFSRGAAAQTAATPASEAATASSGTEAVAVLAAPRAAAAPMSASPPMRTVRELLPIFHPLAPGGALAVSGRGGYASQPRTFSVSLATDWFTGAMPYFRGPATCPASQCRVSLHNRGTIQPWEADVVLYHMGPADYARKDGGGVDAPAHAAQLVALMAAEGFDLAEKDDSLFSKFNAEHSFRATSVVRDTYVLWFVNDAHKQGIAARQRPLALDARVWADIWEPPLPPAARSRTAIASWASHYCRGARSNREDLVRELIALGVAVVVYGEDANCLRNDFSPRSGDQFAAMRTHKFYFAFENHRLDGYVTEKFYWALLRGQVPVVWGAPDIARYAPGPESFIDASAFPSAAALAAHLRALDADDNAYAALHAWRTERSFADYGDILRDELIEMIWIGNATMEPAAWYECRWCHALERARERGVFNAPPQLGIPTMKSTSQPAWPKLPSAT
jgi:hypothetical protein